MNVCVFQPPNGAVVRYRSLLGAQPVRLVNRVLVEVSSMKTRCVRALSKKGLRRVVQCWRACRMSGRSCSLARSVFFCD